MNPETEKTLAFFGRMTANLTHEFKNILAIIQESAGLMEDIMAISPLAKDKYQERFNNSMNTIKNQLQRGMELATRFNRFAHTPDHSRAELELAETMVHFCTLTERFARLKHISLQAGNQQGQEIKITTNPLLLYMVLFYSLDACLSVLPAQCEIRLIPVQKDENVAVEIACSGKQAPSAEDFFTSLRQSSIWADLENAAEQLNAELKCNTDDLRFYLILK
ncbi:MAG: HAMP domain-containing histidine kinase [Desulfobacterales bacterium]|nr:HAMP domain-containing histidine kinase [Desulfobacterales bacterium]